METTTKREDVIAFARKTHDESQERVQYTDYERFRTLYTDTHRILRDEDPSNLRIRRAFNKYKAISVHDDAFDIYAGVLILSFACDLDPSFDYLELAL